jgi:hypothetical protein
VSGADHTWDELTAGDPALAEFAADRWLGARRRLPPLPSHLPETRLALHAVAYFVLAPARYDAVERLGLRYTMGGIGTPFHGAGTQLRVQGTTLVVQRGSWADAAPLSSLGEACAAVGIPWRPRWFDGFHDPLPEPDPTASLRIDAGAAGVLADWFGYATALLEELRRTPGAREVSRVQIWPEHLDAAVEIGEGARRAAYGASPGDDAHPEPYLYVSPWEKTTRRDPYWNATRFGGAMLPYAAVAEADDQLAAGLRFLRDGHRLLGGG